MRRAVWAALLVGLSACHSDPEPGVVTNFPYVIEGDRMIVEGRDTIPVIPEYRFVNRLGGKYYYVLNLGPGAGSVLYNSESGQALRLSSVFEHHDGNGVLVSKPSGLVGEPFHYTLRSVDGQRSVEVSSYEVLEDHVRVVRADTSACYDFSLAPVGISC